MLTSRCIASSGRAGENGPIAKYGWVVPIEKPHWFGWAEAIFVRVRGLNHPIARGLGGVELFWGGVVLSWSLKLYYCKK